MHDTLSVDVKVIESDVYGSGHSVEMRKSGGALGEFVLNRNVEGLELKPHVAKFIDWDAAPSIMILE